jgi:cysteine desulfuration protein SufE
MSLMTVADERLTFDRIRNDFAYLEDWEDRYRYLIELGRRLEPLPEGHRNDDNKVRGCASQVWLWTRADPSAPARLRFVGDSDAHIVRGLIAVLIALFDNRTAAEIDAIDAEARLAELDLAEHLSSQRSNGLRAMVKRIKADAREALGV